MLMSTPNTPRPTDASHPAPAADRVRPSGGAFHRRTDGFPAPPASRSVPMADLQSYASHVTIARLDRDGESVVLAWSDGRISRFHYGWLRENCPCPACRHPASRERIVDPLSIATDIVPAIVDIDADGALTLRWPAADGGAPHSSRYDAGWLRAHCYSSGAPAAASAPVPVDRVPSDPAEPPAVRAWSTLTADEAAFADWLKALARTGWSLVSGVPDADGACLDFGRRIGVLRESNFGLGFDVRSKKDPNSNAYTALYLPLHTDLPHYELPPGLQLLHCRVNDAVGGDSLLVDGVAVARALRAADPEAYRLLTTESVPFRFQDANGDYRARHPVIACDAAGEPVGVAWSNSTAAPLDVPAPRMPAMRRALRRFLDLVEGPRFRIAHRLGAGEMLVFDNRRMLHGRLAFDPRTGDRHLQGCYLDTAELASRIAVLDRRHGAPVGRAD